MIDAKEWRSERFPGDKSIKNLGTGDSYYVPDLLSSTEALTLFNNLTKDSGLVFKQMFMARGKGALVEVPRLQITMGKFIDNGVEKSWPIYRYPSYNETLEDMQEFSPEVEDVRARVEKLTGHKMNHCVLNL